MSRSLSKPKRIINLSLLRSYHFRKCEVCGTRPSDPAHIRSVGCRGDDIEKNLMALCRKHHAEQHQSGLKSFIKKYNLPVTWVNGYPERSDAIS